MDGMDYLVAFGRIFLKARKENRKILTPDDAVTFGFKKSDMKHIISSGMFFFGENVDRFMIDDDGNYHAEINDKPVKGLDYIDTKKPQ